MSASKFAGPPPEGARPIPFMNARRTLLWSLGMVLCAGMANSAMAATGSVAGARKASARKVHVIVQRGSARPGKSSMAPARQRPNASARSARSSTYPRGRAPARRVRTASVPRGHGRTKVHQPSARVNPRLRSNRRASSSPRPAFRPRSRPNKVHARPRPAFRPSARPIRVNSRPRPARVQGRGPARITNPRMVRRTRTVGVSRRR